MAYIRNGIISDAIDMLKEVARVATMETANFSDEIKERTRLWRESWIIAPVVKVINELENKKK